MNVTSNMMVRIKAVYKLGGMCKRCGCCDWRVLEIHHVHGGGNQERRTRSGLAIWYDIIAERVDLHQYEALCANCHAVVTLEQQGYIQPMPPWWMQYPFKPGRS